MLKICLKCKVELKVEKIGVNAVFGKTYVFSGDILKCPDCGHEIIVTAEKAFHDPNALTRMHVYQIKDKV